MTCAIVCLPNNWSSCNFNLFTIMWKLKFGIQRRAALQRQRKTICSLEMVYSCLNEARSPSWWRSSQKPLFTFSKSCCSAQESHLFWNAFIRILRTALSNSMRRRFLTPAETIKRASYLTTRATLQFLLPQRHRSSISFTPAAP